MSAATVGTSKNRLKAGLVDCRGEGRDSEADDGPSLLSTVSFQLLCF